MTTPTGTGVAPARSRPRSQRAASLGVDWHLPHRDGGYARRRFATTTVASSDLISVLAEDGATWGEVAERIVFDDEARRVAVAFVEAGHGEAEARTMIAPPPRGRSYAPDTPAASR